MGEKIKTSDIAKEAGVSPATVSRVINHRELVKEEKVAAVVAAMERLGLTPPAIATPQKRVDSKTILVNFPKGSNPFYEEILEGAISSAAAHGYDLVYNYDNLRRSTFDRFVRLVKNINAAGVILLAALEEDLLSELYSIVPVIQCCEYNKHSSLPYVSVDDYDSARKVVNYLISTGRNKIAFINGPLSMKYAKERLAGFQSAMDDASLSVPSGWVISVPEINYDIAYTVVSQLLQSESRPNAFFAASDVLAAAVVNAARNMHIHVPDDLMVVGFDNIPLCQMIRPTLSSVNQPKFRIGFTACEMLCEMIASPDALPQSVLLPTELIVRESSGGIL